MTIIIRNNTVITTNTSYSEQVQIASGATLTILPGVSINLNGNKMLIAGSLNLSGSATNFSNITNGTISTENTSGSIIATNAKFSGVTIDDFFSDGSIQVTSSVFESSSVRTLPSSVFTSVLFTNTTLNISGTKGGSFIHDTFLNSPMSIMAWFGGSQTSISDSNFIGIGNVITLDPFFSGNGSSHNISITNSYIAGVTGPAIDGKIFDADDDIRVSTDITPSSFTSSPYVNDVNGFRIGNTLVSLNQLGVIDSTAPIVSTFTPADSSISAPITSNISLHFNEVIQKGAGIIAIHSGSAGGTVVESFNATNSSRLTISGNILTINPTNNLANNTHYFVTFASGTVKDLTGNSYAGTSIYDFTTVKNTITGTTGNDKLVGTIGDDILNGGAGADKMTGGLGKDIYYVDNIGDVVTETSALLTEIDTVYSAVTYTLGANLENLTLIGAAIINGTGNALNNTLTGNAGTNLLSGLAGNDILNGGAGIDILIGGAGKDSLSGGLGNDSFDFNTYSEMGLGLTRDVITDFVRGQDKVDLSTIDPNAALAGNQAFTFIASTTAFSVAGQVRYSAGIIAINIDTDAATEYEIQLTGVIPAVLAATDFVL